MLLLLAVNSYGFSASGMEVKYEVGPQIEFLEILKIKDNVKTNIKGSLSYMMCNDKQCLPPKEVAFDLPVQ